MFDSFVVRRLGALATTAVLALGMLTAGTVAQSRPALAASCNGSSCDFVDPQASGCSADAVTLDSVSTTGGFVVQLRWSKTCHAGWARSAGGYAGEITVEINRYQCRRFQGGVCTSPLITAQELLAMFSGGWTDMVGDTQLGVQAVDVTHGVGTGLWHNGVAVDF